MIQSTEPRLIFGALLLGAALLSGCEGDARPFEEAVEVQLLDLKRLAIVPPANETTGTLVINQGQSVQMFLRGFSVTDPDFETDTGETVSTSDRSWSSSDPSIVSVNRNGLITGGEDGTATVSIVFGDLDATLPVTVADAELISIDSIQSATDGQPLEPCLPQEYFALGTFGPSSDTTTRPVYDATYTLNEDSEAILSIVDGIRAKVSATTLDAVTLTATLEGDEPASTETQLTATDTLTTVTLDPASTVSVNEDASVQLKALGTYSVAAVAQEPATTKIRDITDSINWEITDGAAIARVGNTDDNRGKLTGLAAGQAAVIASCTKDSEPLQVTVNEASAATSEDLSFQIGNDDFETGDRIDIAENETRALRVSRGSTYDSNERIRSNLKFTAIPEDVVDLALLNDQSKNEYTIDPEANSAGSTTRLLVQLTDNEGESVAEGTLNIFIQVPSL